MTRDILSVTDQYLHGVALYVPPRHQPISQRLNGIKSTADSGIGNLIGAVLLSRRTLVGHVVCWSYSSTYCPPGSRDTSGVIGSFGHGISCIN